MQPLYLNAPEVRRVSLEGPALKVVCRNVADQYFPLARLSRVISRGPVSWSSAALLECLRHGVPVTLLDHDGQLLGMCFGAWRQDSGFSALLDAFFTLEDGPQRLIDWFCSQSRKRLLKLLKRQRLQLNDLRIRNVKRSLGEELKRRDHRIHPELIWRLRPLTVAQVSEVLTAYKIQPAILEPSHDWRGLIAYLADVLEWEWWEWALAGCLRPCAFDQRSVTDCYQQHATAISERTRNLLEKLWRWLEQSETYSA